MSARTGDDNVGKKMNPPKIGDHRDSQAPSTPFPRNYDHSNVSDGYGHGMNGITNENETLIQRNHDLSETYFLIADFLRRATPCSRAAAVLEEELNAMGLFSSTVNWQGETKPATYMDLQLQNRHLPPTHLLSLIQNGSKGKSILKQNQNPSPSTSEERRSALETLIKLWSSIRSNKRKINQINILLEKIKLRKQHLAEVDEVDLVAEHRGAKQLIELEEQVKRDNQLSLDTWKRVESWGLPRPIQSPKTNYFRHLRLRNVLGRSIHPTQTPIFTYSRYHKLKTLSGHIGLPVFCVTYDKSGKYVITGADDHLVKIWSAQTGDLLYTLHGHVGNITDMDVHPTNGLLVTSSDDNTARVWEISTGFSVAVLVGHTGDVNTTRFHPSHNVVVSASDDGSCCMFRLPDVTPPSGPETKTETVMRLFNQHAYCLNIKPFVVLNHISERFVRSSKVVALAFSPQGDVVVTGGQDGVGRVWQISEFLEQEVPVQSVADVDTVVSSIPQEAEVSNATFVVQQRPTETPIQPESANPHWANSRIITTPIAELVGHTQGITSIHFKPTGDAIATTSMKDGTTRLWTWSKKMKYDKITHNILKGPEMLVSTRRSTSELSTDQILWTSDGTRLITLHSRKPELSGKWCQAMRIWDPATCKPLRTLSHSGQGHSNAVFALDSHPTDSRILLTAGYDGRIIIWDIETGRIIRHFQNWESTTITDGCAILDASFSPNGDNFSVSDRAGRLIMFGTGSGDAMKATPSDQYFSNDYAPIDCDANLNVVYRETQVPPHLLPRSVLMDMGRNVYPQQPLHLMQPLSLHDFNTNLELRQKQALDSQVFESIIDKESQEPFVDANFVEEPILRPLVKTTAPVQAFRLNGDAVSSSELRRRPRQRTAQITERDTSILNDVLPSSEDDDEDFQVNPQVEDDEEEDDDGDDDDEAGSDGLENLDTDMVIGRAQRGARSSRRRLRGQEDESNDEEDETPARNRRRVRSRRAVIEDDVEETKEDPIEEVMDQPNIEYIEEDLVVESSEGVTVSGNQRDRFDETKTYSQLFAQKSTITCGFCGRRDQGGMFELPGQLMGQHPLINGNQRIFVHDQCAISSPLSFFHEGAWYNVLKELRRGRSLKCVYCNQRGATIGCNKESCTVTIHLPCGMVNGYNVDKVHYFCAKHASHAPPSNSTEQSITESFIRRMGHQYDRVYCQQTTSAPHLALIPQVGDVIVYCPQGHAVFLKSFPSKYQPPFKRTPELYAAMQCRVVDVQYKFPPVEAYPHRNRIVMELVMDVLGLPQRYLQEDSTLSLLDFGTFVSVNDQFLADDSETRPKWRFRIEYQPSECAEFLILEQKFASGFEVDLAIGNQVQMAYHTLDNHGMIQDTQLDTGTLLEISPLEVDVFSPWECITVQWDNEESTCRVSPWELESIQSNLPLPIIPGSETLLRGLQCIQQLSVAAGFNDPVPTSTADYHIMIPNPIDLSLICDRIANRYYRQVDALLADVKLMVRNCETYNIESSVIAQNARSVLTNIQTLLNQEFPGHEWLPDIQQDDGSTPLETIESNPYASVPTLEPDMANSRHRSLKREHGGYQFANKRTTSERDQKILQQLRIAAARREEFQRIYTDGKLVECLIQVHTYAQAEDIGRIFTNPVTDDIAPGYSSIIFHPMDFTTMKSKIPQYPSFSAYYDDYMLMIENAMKYNGPQSEIFAEARRMKAALPKSLNRVLGNPKGKGKATRKYESDEESADSSSEDEIDEIMDESDEESEENESDDDDSDLDRRKKTQRGKKKAKPRRKHSFD